MSNQTLLQRAIACLAIQGVFVRECHLTMSPEFDPRVPGTVGVQLKIEPIRVDQVSYGSEGEGSPSIIFVRVHVKTGIRFVETGTDKQSSKETDVEIQGSTKAELLTVFIAEYQKLCEDLEQPAIEEFAQKNAAYHIWPYWREHVQNMCARTGLPVFPLPMYSLKPRPADPVEKKAKES